MRNGKGHLLLLALLILVGGLEISCGNRRIKLPRQRRNNNEGNGPAVEEQDPGQENGNGEAEGPGPGDSGGSDPVIPDDPGVVDPGGEIGETGGNDGPPVTDTNASYTRTEYSPARVAEVTPMVSARVTGLGSAIGNRQAWAPMAKIKGASVLLQTAEKSRTSAVPPFRESVYLSFSKTGSRKAYDELTAQRRGRLPLMVMAECVENKGRFLKKIEEVITTVCAEPTWVLPQHDRTLVNLKGTQIDIDLHSAELASTLAQTDWFLGDKLSARTRQLIRREVDRRVLMPYRDMVEGRREENWWLTSNNNWNSVCLSGVTHAALALKDTPAERAFYIAAAEAYSNNFLAGYTSDGYCGEGVGYWNYGFGGYTLLAEVIRAATSGRIDLMDRPTVRDDATFGLRIEIVDGVYPAFADAIATIRAEPRLALWVCDRFGIDRKLAPPVRKATRFETLAHFALYMFPPAQPLPRASASQGANLIGVRSYFDQAGVLVVRPNSGVRNGLGAALKCGNNEENHNHNDIGSFQLALNGSSPISDPGSEVYTKRTFSPKQRYQSKVINSFGHPVPMVAGRLQEAGPGIRGKVLKTEFTPSRDIFTIDMAPAYKVTGLRKLEREFVFDRSGRGALTVTDSVSFGSPQEFETALITLGSWKKISSNELQFTQDKGTVRVRITAEGAGVRISGTTIDEKLKAGGSAKRIAIALDKKVTNASITMHIMPAN